MVVVYLHGFASSGVSTKVDQLRARFPNDTVLAPNLPFDPYEVCEVVHRIVMGVAHSKNPSEPIVFVGTSMGGFYANYFGQLYDCPAIVVNPSSDPAATIADRIGMNVNFSTGETFEVSEHHLTKLKMMTEYAREFHSGRIVSLFLAEDDDVIPYKAAIDAYPFSSLVTVTRDGGHRYEKHWKRVIDRVAEFRSVS